MKNPYTTRQIIKLRSAIRDWLRRNSNRITSSAKNPLADVAPMPSTTYSRIGLDGIVGLGLRTVR